MMISIDKTRQLVEDVLEDFLEGKLESAETIHPSYRRLIAEIKRVTLAGGKRLRPHLVCLGYGTYDDTIIKIAAAHEMLHVAMLVHDDIIDRDHVRHDQPTIHHQYSSDHYQGSDLNHTDRLHFSNSSALLAGDLMISFAYELLALANLDAPSYRQVTQYFSTGIFEVVGGELLDVEAAFASAPLDPIIIYRYKTASYSIISPLLSGAALSSQHYNEGGLRLLHDFAANFGIAFQIQDDLLGVFGDSQITGKSTISDLVEGKITLLISEFRRLADETQIQLLTQVLGNPAADETVVNELKKALIKSGALDSCQAIAKSYIDSATNSLDSISDNVLRSQLGMLVQRYTSRQS